MNVKRAGDNFPGPFRALSRQPKALGRIDAGPLQIEGQQPGQDRVVVYRGRVGIVPAVGGPYGPVKRRVGVLDWIEVDEVSYSPLPRPDDLGSDHSLPDQL